jgi:iron complex outermembrane receptor protein
MRLSKTTSSLCLGLLTSLTGLWGMEHTQSEIPPDSLRLYFLKPMTLTAKLSSLGLARASLGGAPIERAMADLGLQPIRRGAALTSDVSAGTFNRGDLEILIDGERHPNACPNRMDNASTRMNPAEMVDMEVLRSCCAASCGLGGLVEYHRRQPSQALAVDADLQSSLMASTDQVLAVGVEGAGVRLSARHLLGSGFKDGQGRDFQELYPFSDAADYRSSEVALQAVRKDWSGGLSFSDNQDVPFPYLQMDERETRHVSAFLTWRHHKLYVNQTDHLMDNALRTVNGLPLSAPSMSSDARNVIVGLSGTFYHLSFFRWDLDNRMLTPSGILVNHMIPDLTQVTAEGHHTFTLVGPWSLSLRAGLVLDRARDSQRVENLLGRLYSDPVDHRGFVTHGVALQSHFHLGELKGAALLESASDDPGLETLWMALQKPAGKPWWLGNPTLETALRHTLRGKVTQGPFELEAAVSRVNRYVVLQRASFATSDSTRQQVQSYGGANADMVEAQFSYSGSWLTQRACFAWGQDRSLDEPLAEMSPFYLETVLSHHVRRLQGPLWLRHTWTAAQRRVSNSQNERATGAWNRVDLGLTAEWQPFTLSLEMDNVLDHTYAQHLSYARNPFSAGDIVWEAGRTLLLRLHYVL